jgi:type I restriction enzyme S subunit
MEVRKGYKKTEVGVIPEDWDCIQLGNIGDCIIGLTYKPSDVKDYGRLVLRSSNINENRLVFTDNVYVDIPIKDDLVVQENDILICVRNGSRNLIGKCALIDKKSTGQTFGAFMSVFRSIYGRYLFNCFQSSIIKKQLNEIMGATINQITNKDLKSFYVPLPNNDEEQQAIAEALSDVDAVVSSLTKLINKKKNIKQGAMQELLTGKKRLDGFSGDWEVVEFKDIFIKHQTKNYQINSVDYMEVGSHPVIDQGKKKIVAYSERKDKLFSCPTEGIIVFGDHTRELKFINFDFVIGADGTQVISTKNDNNVQYYYYSLMEKEIPNTGYNRHYKYLLEMKFYRPKLEEQTAIASILSDMDAEIEALEQKLNKYKAIKQGMMQELLTGRIRLIWGVM